eukprot:TRINITY_DN36743_c0_g1_i1.p1 TRINITY_DN36743_c0_g1~~TRINITY_DN36743_c0_g1_i1.p1  ORF type:complete len:199 (+),score=16.76 TRINITY_DN36743_c0_g1_i1:32-628(+)
MYKETVSIKIVSVLFNGPMDIRKRATDRCFGWVRRKSFERRWVVADDHRGLRFYLAQTQRLEQLALFVPFDCLESAEWGNSEHTRLLWSVFRRDPAHRGSNKRLVVFELRDPGDNSIQIFKSVVDRLSGKVSPQTTPASPPAAKPSANRAPVPHVPRAKPAAKPSGFRYFPTSGTVSSPPRAAAYVANRKAREKDRND